jgi:ABC-type multidrug transport system fused ATPase/permease subunit
MCYRPNLPKVLKNISLSIKAREKIGVVGRTGAGKSSIMVALFRLIEDSCHEGVIKYDGLNIDHMGVSRLRPELAIIPQDPVLFSGSVRENLDPSNVLEGVGSKAAQDDFLWSVLERVGLKATVQNLHKGLDAIVAEFGDNFSVGQKQLLCLARVLLFNSHIILLDEASSSLDFQSDKLLQEAITTTFNDKTIITIAHRLNTIINYDRILVMENAQIAEFDSPKNLLSNPKSVFSSLVDEMGPAAAAALRNQAISSKSD